MEIASKYQNENFLQIVDQYTIDELVEFSHTIRTLFIYPDEEDRDDILGVFSIFFTNVDIATSGKEALKLFEKNKYDFIIISTEINDMKPIKVAESIRKISRCVTFLAISPKNEQFLDFIGLGIEGYLLKPIDVSKYVKIMTKIIDTMLNKQRLYEYRINLEDMVKEKTAELVQINNELEIRVAQEVEKNRKQEFQILNQAKHVSMGEMIGNIAHQWRQPLSMITTAASGLILKHEHKMLNDDFLIRSLSKIEEYSQYLSKTIDTFRNFATDKKVTRKVNLIDIIDDALKIVETNLKNNHIELVNKIDETIHVHYTLIVGEFIQVIINIINNAKDVLVEKNIQNPWIELSLQQNKNRITISIEDNAGGIPDDVLPRIFEPYFTTKHQSQGTGLGLHMSYRIITDSIKGHLYAKNTKNGAKFFIELPLH